MKKAKCYDCGLDYGDKGFPDLIIPNWAWRKISPAKDRSVLEGGLLCPNCICRALEKKKIKCYGAFMSGAIQSVSRLDMENLRWIENCRETLEGNNLYWKSPKNNAKI